MATPTSSGQVSSVADTSQTYINALLVGSKWGGAAGTGLTLTYSFPSYGSSWSTASVSSGGYGPSSGSGEPWGNNLTPLNTVQQSAFAQALQSWAAVANISFVQVDDTASQVGDIRVAFSATLSSDTSGHAYYPYGQQGSGGDVWLNPNVSANQTPLPGNFGFEVMVHEIGHALGLKHPFDGSPTLTGAANTTQYTVMAYDEASGATISPAGPMLYDIAAIQYLYGANTSYRTGNDVYQFSASSEELKTIWDAGGTDTFDASNQVVAATINLNAGSFSSIGIRTGGSAARQNIAIAYGAVIENAKGGTGNDSIIGNAEANVLEGNNGADTISGAAGRDELHGGAGGDLLFGNQGEDTLFGDAGDDRLYGGVDNDSLVGGDGADQLNGDNGADVLAGNRGADTLFGNAGADTLFGGADGDLMYGGRDDDRLFGDAGADTLVGGLGADTLTGGGDGDLFRFQVGDGTDTVTDFDFNAGDRLAFGDRTYALKSAASGDLVIDFLNGDTITLMGVAPSQFSSSWLTT